MYLENIKTREAKNFLYTLGYGNEEGIVFKINPFAIKIFDELPEENLLTQYFSKTLHLNGLEKSLEKNFGFNNCSKQSFSSGLVHISFPLTVDFLISEKNCERCDGSGIAWEKPCYQCRGTGKMFTKNINLDEICASIKALTHYLNWTCLMDDENPIPENNFGKQNIFLETDAIKGIGGECSEEFYQTLIPYGNLIEKRGVGSMFDIHQKIEGGEKFKNFKFHTKMSDFRCEVSQSGRMYVEVPGQNGCSIHMMHASDTQFTCHNIDVPSQQLPLLSGFAIIVDEFEKNKI